MWQATCRDLECHSILRSTFGAQESPRGAPDVTFANTAIPLVRDFVKSNYKDYRKGKATGNQGTGCFSLCSNSKNVENGYTNDFFLDVFDINTGWGFLYDPMYIYIYRLDTRFFGF